MIVELTLHTDDGSFRGPVHREGVFHEALEELLPEPLRVGNLGFDHLALAVADRQDARRFFADVLRMQVVRDEPHQTVLTTRPTAIFLFDAKPGPLNPGVPSRIHHIGFVVDDLEAAWHHVRVRGLRSDYMVLERDERWSLYFFYDNGDAQFMIQLSQIKPEARGFVHPRRFADLMYDYARGRYGVRFVDDNGGSPWRAAEAQLKP